LHKQRLIVYIIYIVYLGLLMIRHLVMWTLHNPNDAPYFKAQLDSCKGMLDGLLELDVGIMTASLEANCDVALNALLRDEAALNDYHAHPQHQQVKQNIAGLARSRQVLDYIVP
jgi:hypothetical protein